jgi:D-alanyl-D-alanine carboxypeptidase/D-alanyl-D-alanine-endopeptidase (penicillin-binding protein 4)
MHFSINDNIVAMRVNPGKTPGHPASIVLDEKIPYFSIINLTVTSTEEMDFVPSLSISRGFTDNRVIVSGSIPTGNPEIVEKIAIHNPVEYGKQIFIKFLRDNDVEYEEKKTQCKGTEEILLSSITSPPLKEIIQKMNKWSSNITAELLIQTVSFLCDRDASPLLVRSGKPAFEYLSTMMHLPESSFKLCGGAGMSRHNSLKPNDVIKLLQIMHASEYKDAFIQSLPIAGIDGTLANRFKETFAVNNVKAKTGTLTGVSSLAGYATTKSGKNIAFCLFVNLYNTDASICQKHMDQLLLSMLERL